MLGWDFWFFAKCHMWNTLMNTLHAMIQISRHWICISTCVARVQMWLSVVCYIWMKNTKTNTNMKKNTNTKTNINTRSGKVWCVIYGWGGGDALPCNSPRIQSTQLIKMRIQRQIQIWRHIQIPDQNTKHPNDQDENTKTNTNMKKK